MNSSRESAAREQWMDAAAVEIVSGLHDEIKGDGTWYNNEGARELVVDEIASHYAAREREEWIPVSERLPEELDRILFVTLEVGGCDEGLHPEIHIGTMYTASGILYAEPEDIDGEFSAALGIIAKERDGAITHWRPLPATPFAAKGETGSVAAQGEQHD